MTRVADLAFAHAATIVQGPDPYPGMPLLVAFDSGRAGSGFVRIGEGADATYGYLSCRATAARDGHWWMSALLSAVAGSMQASPPAPGRAPGTGFLALAEVEVSGNPAGAERTTTRRLSPLPPMAGWPVVSRQDWMDTAFVHWRIPPETAAAFLPPGLAPDVFDGSSWIGLIAFELRHARFAPFSRGPSLPPFTEVNLRLSAVDAQGRRGVVFLSMEAGSLLLTLGARAAVSLPYFWARAGQRTTPTGWSYASRRRPAPAGAPAPSFRLDIAVDRSRILTDDLSTFLTARWGLFQRRFGRTLWMPNVHEPWVLHPARVLRLDDELCAAAGFPKPAGRTPDSVLFSPGVHARFGLPTRITHTPQP